jgi:hypothetical protein
MAATLRRSDGATLFELAKDCHGITEAIPKAVVALAEVCMNDLRVCFIFKIFGRDVNRIKSQTNFGYS